MVAESTSGSTLSQEIIKLVQVEREMIDRLRFGTILIQVVDGIVLRCSVTQDKKRGKEIDYL